MTASITRRVAIPTIPEMPHAAPAGERIRELAGSTMGTTWSVKFVGSSTSVQTVHRMIPLALERVGFDPAVASSIFVTTFTDVAGFFSFLGLATLALRYLG